MGVNVPEYDEAPLNLVASHVTAAEEMHWSSTACDTTIHYDFHPQIEHLETY